MVNVNRVPGFGDGSDGINLDATWKMQNVDDFKRWIADNKKKVDEGGEVVQSVVSIGSEVASAACVKRFRQRGWKASAVEALTEEIADRILAKCDDGRQDVLMDCARIYSGSGNTMLVMVMAFVSYSLIGVQVAEDLISEQDED